MSTEEIFSKSNDKSSSEKQEEEFQQIAQALDDEELNNLSDVSNREAISPVDNIEENTGQPNQPEQNIIDDIIPQSQDSQVINAEDLEGFAADGGPQDGAASVELTETLSSTNISPEKGNALGAPSQGLITEVDNINEQNEELDIAPESLAENGALKRF